MPRWSFVVPNRDYTPMSSSSRPLLNRFTVLRYDNAHVGETVAGASPGAAAPDVSAGSEHMDVSGINSVSRPLPISQPRPAVELEQTSSANVLSPQDEVDISPAGKMLDNLSRTSSLRDERLAQIKAAIADGTYETPEKLEGALNRLLEQHGLNEDA